MVFPYPESKSPTNSKMIPQEGMYKNKSTRCFGYFRRVRNSGPPYVTHVEINRSGDITLSVFDARTSETQYMTGTYKYSERGKKISAYYTKVDGEKHLQNEIYYEKYSDNTCISLEDGYSNIYISDHDLNQ